MPFAIDEIDPETCQSFFAAAIAARLDKILWQHNRTMAKPVGHTAVDHHRHACLTRIDIGPKPRLAYAFFIDDEYALFEEVGRGVYAFIFMSSNMLRRLREIEDLIAQALCMGGAYLDGTTDPNDVLAVREVRFHGWAGLAKIGNLFASPTMA